VTHLNAEYQRWLAQDSLDPSLKSELLNMSAQDIDDAFSGPITFGTGGIRGLLGVGPSRLNQYTVLKALTGYARFLVKTQAIKSVVIAYDNRHQSFAFSELAACVLATHGIKALVFESLRPTPLLSYAVRKLSTGGGIMITASHNPKEYNGLKMYDALGCQLVPSEASKVIDEIDLVEDYFEIKVIAKEEALNKRLIETIALDLDDIYLEDVLSLAKEGTKTLNVGFSPQHGTAAILGPKLLEKAGFKVFVEASQMDPDPDFKGTLSANPENKEAFEKLALLGFKHQCDLLMTTDPDADRIGIAVYHEGVYHYLNGNQVGVLLLDYMLKEKADEKDFKHHVMFTTIVSTDMAEKMIKKAKLHFVKTLTGFKFIGEQMELLKDTPFKFLMGFEESYGYVLKDITRDKDALQAMIAIAELAETLKKENRTLIDQLDDLYKTYGTYIDDLENIHLKGLKGKAQIQAIMDDFRIFMPKNFSRKNLIRKEDYLALKAFSPEGEKTLNYPPENVLKFILKDAWFVLRPSGTEPKLKIYFMVKEDSKEEATEIMKELKTEVLKRVDAILESERDR
jgi:phosphoglucomutase